MQRSKTDEISEFFARYDEKVCSHALLLRKICPANLPKVIERLDVPAKMVVYTYGQSYKEMICTIIPSQKGVKLGFYRGVDLPDPQHLLRGSGKISRYIDIKSSNKVDVAAVEALLQSAVIAYKKRMA